MDGRVWIMGQIKSDEEYKRWEFMGIFTTEAKAIAACTTERHFIGPAGVNVRQSDDTLKWEGAYYPLRAAEETDGRL